MHMHTQIYTWPAFADESNRPCEGAKLLYIYAYANTICMYIHICTYLASICGRVVLAKALDILLINRPCDGSDLAYVCMYVCVCISSLRMCLTSFWSIGRATAVIWHMYVCMCVYHSCEGAWHPFDTLHTYIHWKTHTIEIAVQLIQRLSWLHV